MRIAVVSDIHGNLTALEAVIADLRETAPDIVIHGGDLVGGGPRPAEVVDRIRALDWPGVYGNTDEMLWKPHRVSEVLHAPQVRRIAHLLLDHTIPATLHALGDARLAWMRTLPLRHVLDDLTIVHAGPDDVWQSTSVAATDEELATVFGALNARRVVYGHLHVPFVRRLTSMTVVNSGAVGQPFDGDPRAAYALLDEEGVHIRRVFYDVEAEVRLLSSAQDPFAPSMIQTLRSGRYTPPGA